MTKRFFDFPETYIYYTLCIYLLQKLKKNVQANFVMGLIFRTSWRVAPTKKKFLMGIWIFGILCTNVFELSIDNPCQNFEVFFIQDFQPNLEVFAKIEIFEIFFIQDFQPNLEVFAKIEIFIFKRISSQKRASLARTVPKPSMRQSCTYCAEAFTLLGWCPLVEGNSFPGILPRYRPPTQLVVK